MGGIAELMEEVQLEIPSSRRPGVSDWGGGNWNMGCGGGGRGSERGVGWLELSTVVDSVATLGTVFFKCS
jgi:hypothetical protein